MNEVRPEMPTSSTGRAASSPGAAINQAEKTGKSLPTVAENKDTEQTTEHRKPDTETVEQAVERVNEFVQTVQRNLEFSVDKELNQTVVKVVDRESGEVVRQIPDEVFLELARKLDDNGELHLLDAIG